MNSERAAAGREGSLSAELRVAQEALVGSFRIVLRPNGVLELDFGQSIEMAMPIKLCPTKVAERVRSQRLI